MRFFKLFFSKFLFVFAAICLQIFIFVATNFYLSSTFWWVNYWFNALAFIIFLAVINKDKPASFKLPWVALVLFMPIVGIAIFILFGNYTLSRKARKAIKKEDKKLIRFCKKNKDTMDKLYLENKKAYGQACYIERTCFLPTYENSYNEFLPTGEDFFKSLIDNLKTAKKYIFMEYFIIENGKFWDPILEILTQKALEGVEIYVMYDDFGCVGKLPGSYYLRLRDKGIYATRFNPFTPLVSVAHNNRDHRKITVIDGEIGYISGANIADEYINVTHPYGEWKDNACLLKGECVDSLILMFIRLFNPSSVKKLDVSNYLVEHKKYDENGFVAPYGDGPCPIYNDYISKNVYLNFINQAEKYVYITTPYLIVDYEFLEAICNASKRGVDVKILTPHIPDKRMIKIMTKSNYEKLIINGVKIYEFEKGFVHSKNVVVDDEFSSIGTANFDYRSFVHHFECGVWFYKSNIIKDMKKDFENIINNESIKMNVKNSKLSIPERLIKDLLRLIAPLI